MEKEIWKPVKGYEELYEVSNIGRVRSKDRYVDLGAHHKGYLALKKGKILNEKDNGNGYKSVHFTINRVTEDKYVHRLVADAFIPNPYGLPQVNHKDENKWNNNIENLEWCTPKYNSNYGQNRKKKWVPVLQCSIDGEFIRKFENLTYASRHVNGSPSRIAKVIDTVHTAYGFTWKRGW